MLDSECSLSGIYNSFNALVNPLGPTTTICKIGEGTFGNIYKIKDSLGHDFATKVYKGSDITSLVREISILSTICHPNIIGIFHVDLSINNQSMIMECMSGDLSIIVEKDIDCRLDLLESISFQILLGLEFLHSHGFAHRDIKSNNILVREVDPSKKYYQIKIADFGLARHILDDNTEYYSQNTGAFLFTAPELLFREKDTKVHYGCSIDIWSVGICLVHLLHALPPTIDVDTFVSEGLSQFSNLHYFSEIKGSCFIGMESYLQKKIGRDASRLSRSFFELMDRLLTANPQKRISATDALSMDYFKEEGGQLKRMKPSILTAEKRLSKSNFLQLDSISPTFERGDIEETIRWIGDLAIDLELIPSARHYIWSLFREVLKKDKGWAMSNIELVLFSCLLSSIFLNDTKVTSIDHNDQFDFHNSYSGTQVMNTIFHIFKILDFRLIKDKL